MVILYESPTWLLKSYGSCDTFLLHKKDTDELITIVKDDAQRFEAEMNAMPERLAERFLETFWKLWRKQEIRQDRRERIKQDEER